MGGYQILDFNNKNFIPTVSTHKISGIYDKIKTVITKNPKPFVIYNLIIEDVTISPVYVNFVEQTTDSGLSYLALISYGGYNTRLIIVNSDDTISLE